MAEHRTYKDLYTAYGMQTFDPASDKDGAPVDDASPSRAPEEIDGIGVRRIYNVDKISRDHKAGHKAKDSSDQKDALADVYAALDELKATSQVEVGIDVLEEATVVQRAMRGIRGGKLRKRSPFTISEYLYGSNDPAVGQQKYKVAESLGGWAVPRVLFKDGEPFRKTRPDLGVPHARDISNLVISEDGRSWENASFAPTTGDELIAGVRGDEHIGHYALERYPANTLRKVEEALRYMAANPIHPLDTGEQIDGTDLPSVSDFPTPASTPVSSSGRHAAPEEPPTSPLTQPLAPTTPQPTANIPAPQPRPRRRATSGVFDIDNPTGAQPPAPEAVKPLMSDEEIRAHYGEYMEADNLRVLDDVVRKHITDKAHAAKADPNAQPGDVVTNAEGKPKLSKDKFMTIKAEALEEVVREYVGYDAPDEVVAAVTTAYRNWVEAQKKKPPTS